MVVPHPLRSVSPSMRPYPRILDFGKKPRLSAATPRSLETLPPVARFLPLKPKTETPTMTNSRPENHHHLLVKRAVKGPESSPVEAEVPLYEGGLEKNSSCATPLIPNLNKITTPTRRRLSLLDVNPVHYAKYRIRSQSRRPSAPSTPLATEMPRNPRVFTSSKLSNQNSTSYSDQASVSKGASVSKVPSRDDERCVLKAEISFLRDALLTEQSVSRRLTEQVLVLQDQILARDKEIIALKTPLPREEDQHFLVQEEEEEVPGTTCTEWAPELELKEEEKVDEHGLVSAGLFRDEADEVVKEFIRKKQGQFPYQIAKISPSCYVFGRERKNIYKRGGGLFVRVSGGVEELGEYLENMMTTRGV